MKEVGFLNLNSKDTSNLSIRLSVNQSLEMSNNHQARNNHHSRLLLRSEISKFGLHNAHLQFLLDAFDAKPLHN